MSVPIITFFNNKGGVGKTSLVYHLAWMFSMRGERVLALDLDPQANLTAAFLDEEALESLWEGRAGPTTVFRAIEPITGMGDLLEPALVPIADGLHLMPGDVRLAGFEETLSNEWPESMREANLARPFRILTAFWQIAQMAAARMQATMVLADVGPNLGAINRSALIASDFVVIPLGADLFSLQGLKNLGPTLRNWRGLWHKRRDNWSEPSFDLPAGRMQPLGYVVQQPIVRLGRPVRAYDRWVNQMPGVYLENVLGEPECRQPSSPDPNCLATIKHFRSLVPMAQDARKPIFALTPADGAIGAHAAGVRQAFTDFEILADRIQARLREALAQPPPAP